MSFKADFELADVAVDAMFLLALPAAMRRAEPLRIDEPVSLRLLAQASRIQQLYGVWDRGLAQVPIEAPARTVPFDRNTRSDLPRAISFTGGVDSFHAALQDPKAALMYVHGLDVPLRNVSLRQRVHDGLVWAADCMARPMLELETNLREFSDRFLAWNLAFGGALAACALLLSHRVASFGIPAGQTDEDLQPDGAHPALNPLCSTEYLDVVTVGLDASRIEKVRRIANEPVVRGALRVCWENRGGAYNCGVCEKCLRTMAALEIFGALGAFSTFAIPLDYGRLSRAVPPHPAMEQFTRDNLDAAREMGASAELVRSLERALEPRRIRRYRAMQRWVPRRVRDWQYRLLVAPGRQDYRMPC